MYRIVLCILTLGASACGTAPESRNEIGACDEFRARIADDPARAAESALSREDRRFLAVEGYTVTVPGVEDGTLIARHGYAVLEGTTDAPTDVSCEKYQSEAIAYAEKYNLKKIGLLKTDR